MLLSCEALGDECAEEAWMTGQRSELDNSRVLLEGETQGEAEGEKASAVQPVEELLLAGLTQSLYTPRALESGVHVRV